MRDINQKASDTDKQIAIGKSLVPKPFALRRSVWLSSLNTKRAISTGGLSIFAVAALLGIKPAQANITDQSPSLPNQTAEEEQAIPTSKQSTDAPNDATAAQSELQSLWKKVDAQAKLNQGQPGQADVAPTQPPDALALRGVAQQDSIASGSQKQAFTSKSLTPVGSSLAVIPEIENHGTLALPAPAQYNFAPSAIERGNFSSLQPQPSTGDEKSAVPIANSLSFTSGKTTALNSNHQAQVSHKEQPTTGLPAVASSTEEAEAQNAVENKVAEPLAQTEQPTTILPGFSPEALVFSPTSDAVEDKVGEPQSTKEKQPSTILPGFSPGETAFSPTSDAVEYKVWDSEAKGKQPTTILPTFALKADASAQSENPASSRVPQSMAGGTQPTRVAQASAPDATAATSKLYSGPGAARLLGDNIQAQSDARKLATATLSLDAAQEAQSENAAQTNNPLAPSLVFQGGFITQGETGARARLTGLYPVSPSMLFGGTVDLTTGEGFSDTPGTGIDITELYVTTSLPSYPNLRLTAGLVDLTSYFDRNSFAKDSLTHFFHPVFQTNPALARTGIASRPAALLNWDITDNFNARAAAFSSSRNLGELAVDGFAGELAYRFDNGIIRATYASDRDDQRNGFEEIYGLRRGNGELGPRTSDRESSYGINAEYYIPEIKMGLFGRYGHYQNTTMGRGGDTYSAGLNFLDLFMKDDRLGFGYGRDLSNSSLRRRLGNKTPDVWEVFYDFRVTPYLRAGVTLQARDEFSDIVAGFRVKTEFDLLNLGRVFK